MGNGLVISGFGINALPATAFTADALTSVRYGVHVARATKNLPQTATEAAFTVAGGLCAVHLIVGQVTTVVQTQACNLKVNANPTVGTSVDISADLNISALAAGIILDITGTFANAVAQGLALPGQTAPVIVDSGTIDLITSASNTGQLKWDLFYFPLTSGATIVAA